MKISFFDKMAVSTENIRYLLWSVRPTQRDSWGEQLAAWLSTKDRDHCADLITGMAVATATEQQQLLEAFDQQYSEQSFQFDRFVTLEAVDILLKNIGFLTEMPGERKLKALARSIDVGPVTLSRWRSGEQRPHKSNQMALISYFGLPHEIDLEVDALFLYPGPLGDAQRRNWLRKQIDRLDPTTLHRLFPALERLFKDA